MIGYSQLIPMKGARRKQKKKFSQRSKRKFKRYLFYSPEEHLHGEEDTDFAVGTQIIDNPSYLEEEK